MLLRAPDPSPLTKESGKSEENILYCSSAAQPLAIATPTAATE
jgi:hypothetical protein